MGLSSAYKYNSYAGVAGADYTEVVFKFPTRWIDIYILNNSATIRLQLQDGVYGDPIIMDPTVMAFPIPLFFKTLGIMIKNTDPSLAASYQFVPNQ